MDLLVHVGFVGKEALGACNKDYIPKDNASDTHKIFRDSFLFLFQKCRIPFLEAWDIDDHTSDTHRDSNKEEGLLYSPLDDFCNSLGLAFYYWIYTKGHACKYRHAEVDGRSIEELVVYALDSDTHNHAQLEDPSSNPVDLLEVSSQYDSLFILCQFFEFGSRSDRSRLQSWKVLLLLHPPLFSSS